MTIKNTIKNSMNALNQSYFSANYIAACDAQFHDTLEAKICKFCPFYDEKTSGKKDALKHCITCMERYYIMWADGVDSVNHVNDYIREEASKGTLTFRERMRNHFGVF